MNKKTHPGFGSAVRGPVPGAVYVWLRRHRRSVARDLADVRASWPEVIRRLETAGVRNKTGTALTTTVVLKTWARVIRDLAADAAKAAEAAKPVNAPPVAVPRPHWPVPETVNRPVPAPPIHPPATPAVVSPPVAASGLAATPANADHPVTAPPLKPWEMTGEQKIAALQQELRDLDPKMPTPRFTGPHK